MKNEFLRHTLATINYRFNKSVSSYKHGFGDFSLGKGSRSPVEIIHHMYEVLHTMRIFIEEERFSKEKADLLDLDLEIERFNLELEKAHGALDGAELAMNYGKRLLQGPLSDILTHVGQIALLQRLNGTAIPGEDFSAASIQTSLS